MSDFAGLCGMVGLASSGDRSPRKRRLTLITITTATPADTAAIAGLLEELDRFYGVTSFRPIEERIQAIGSLLFRDSPAAQVLLAREGSDVAGLAAYSFLWPAAGVTQSLYLKELYVAQSHRKRGIGRALIQRLCEIAVDSGCSRVEWTADRDNPDAQQFYDALGVPVNTSKLFYRIEREGIERLIE